MSNYWMRYYWQLSALVLALGLASPLITEAQAPKKKPSAKRQLVAGTAKAKPAGPGVEKDRFEAAIAATSPTEKAELLVRFVSDFPKSEYKTRAQESLSVARAAMADEKLTAGESEQAVRLFRLAIEDAPKPYGDRLFSSVIVTIPKNLYWRGQQPAALELARLIESNASTNANQLLQICTFYLETENGSEAKRIAEEAIRLNETNATAHQALAAANRLNFDLEAAAASFAKAVELDPESTISKRSLADMKRALGKSEEAEALYRGILAINEKDVQARTGLVLSLFEGGKKTEAEAEMAKALEETPGNVALLAGAAYWYAANGDGDKAVEYARSAVAKEPRYVWSHIALGRGLMAQKKPVEAEQALVAARKYGNFPTLHYEIASARLAAGFFREAAEELKKSFTIEGGSVKTRLGGRIERSGDSFADVIAAERRASILIPSVSDNSAPGEKLKALLELEQRLAAEKKDETEIVAAAERFAAGDDNMAVHRKLYAANTLLKHELATDRALELTRAAMAGIDNSLDVPDPGAAVMASELYEARNVSFAQDSFLLIPEIPKQTLTSLMRGRVEETTGVALLRQGKPEEATVRFRRALTVLPKDSAWWRSATWNLGQSLQAEGKDKEALDAMIASYKIDKPNLARYVAIESLYRKVNGNLDGLENRVGPNPLPSFTGSSASQAAPSAAEAQPTPNTTTAVATEPTPELNNADAPAAKQERLPRTLPINREVTQQTAASTEVKTEPNPSRENPPTTEAPKVTEEVKKADAPPEVKMASTETEVKPTPDASPSPETKEPQQEPKPTITEPITEKKPSSEVTAEPTPEAEKPDQTIKANDAVVKAEAPKQPEPKQPEPEQQKVEIEKAEPKPSPEKMTLDDTTPTKRDEKKEPSRAAKSIFDPIVISAGGKKTEPETEPKPAEEKRPEEAKPEPVPERKAARVVISDGLIRPRVIDGRPVTEDRCLIGVSQENFSLVRNGGSASVLVSIDLGRDARSIVAASSSPDDVEVRPEPDVVEMRFRSLYVIKSVSRKAGVYQVSFKAPCGRKDVIVRVR